LSWVTEGADIIAIDVCKSFDDSAAPGSTSEDLAETADMLKNLDRRIVTAEVDVRDFERMKSVVDGAVEQLGRLDIIVANAGTGTVGVKLHKMDEDRWQEMIDVNLSGVWKTVQAGVPHLLAGGRGGSIILTSSVAGLKAYPHTGHYVAAKHGVVGIMRTFAVELGQHSITVELSPSDARKQSAVDERADISTVSARLGESRTRRSASGAVPSLGRIPLRHWRSASGRHPSRQQGTSHVR
jgi:NAD(P)-dependent dehydrogenase (short-subunit alcohol dehydrogenase family)